MPNKPISLLLTVCMLFSISACSMQQTGEEQSNAQPKINVESEQTGKENGTKVDVNADVDVNVDVKSNDKNESASDNISNDETASKQQSTVSQPKTNNIKQQQIHTHSYSNATCTSPKKCSCGATSGTMLGHRFSNATCTSPKKCTRCGITDGTSLGHQFSNATCTSPKICKRCKVSNGNALGHTYASANCNSPKTCTRCGNETGSALGHNYVNNKCTRCSAVDPNSLPVELHKLTVIDSGPAFGLYEAEGIMDSFGNSYSGYHDFSAGKEGTYAIYYLNNKYAKLSFDIVATKDCPSDGVAIIEVYVDDVLKYSKTNFSRTTGKVSVEVDVKNGERLTIKTIKTDGFYWNVDVALVNARLTK